MRKPRNHKVKDHTENYREKLGHGDFTGDGQEARGIQSARGPWTKGTTEGSKCFQTIPPEGSMSNSRTGAGNEGAPKIRQELSWQFHHRWHLTPPGRCQTPLKYLHEGD